MKVLQAAAFASLMFGSLAANAEHPIIHFTIGGEISPGVYGQVQFGNAPPPPVLYEQPRIIVHQPPNVVVHPLYLHIPPSHAKNWSQYCRKYDACNRPVYFVKSSEYEPGYRSHKDKKHKSKGRKDERRDNYRDERSGESRDKYSDEGRRGGRKDEGHDD